MTKSLKAAGSHKILLLSENRRLEDDSGKVCWSKHPKSSVPSKPTDSEDTNNSGSITDPLINVIENKFGNFHAYSRVC